MMTIMITNGDVDDNDDDNDDNDDVEKANASVITKERGDHDKPPMILAVSAKDGTLLAFILSMTAVMAM